MYESNGGFACEATVLIPEQEAREMLHVMRVDDISQAVLQLARIGHLFMEKSCGAVVRMIEGERSAPCDNPNIHAATDSCAPISEREYRAWAATSSRLGCDMTADEADRFWEFLTTHDKRNSRGRVITISNVAKTCSSWLEIDRREKAANGEARGVDDSVSFRRNKRMLNEFDDD